MSTIEQETSVLQKTAEERSTAATLLAQGTNMIVSTGSSSSSSTTVCASAVTAQSNKLNSVKNSRRNREHRARSQEWPEVPEVGKIQESNPEVLAQKIVETCRQIEAGKFQGAGAPSSQVNGKNKAIIEVPPPPATAPVSIKSSPGHHYKDTTLMPAPKQQQQQQMTLSQLPKCELPGLSTSRKQESPKVANFEDRLKSIITTALNEDQEQRSKAVESSPSPSPLHSPAPKRSKQHPAGAINPAQSLPNNLHNIITVSTQGLMHLNANTTISPITPPLPGPGAGATASTAPPPPANLPYGAYGGAVAKTTISGKYQAAKEPKYSPVRQAPLPPPPPTWHLCIQLDSRLLRRT